MKPQFWNLNAPFVIIRQDLVIVWSHILAENIPNMMKTLAHTSVNFVVMNMEMVQIWRNTCFNIHLKDVISWNGAQMKMHMYRNHSKIVACAMCNFEAKVENFLDTHTFTCEIFNCHYCQSTYVARYKNSYEHRTYSSFWHYKIN